MLLASKLAFQVDRRVQQNGSALFSANAVRATEAAPSHLHAKVVVGRPYEVRLDYIDGRLKVSCQCPDFAMYGRCKHLWAAVLEADKRGALRDALNERYLRIDDGIIREDERRAFGPMRAIPLAPPPPRVPVWQEYLGEIRRE